MPAFQLPVLSDEISPDFGRTCEVAAGQFAMRWIELRTPWDKNIIALDTNEISEPCALSENMA